MNHSKPYHLLTDNAFRLWVKYVPPKGEMTQKDWDSIYAFENTNTQRETIVDKIMQDVEVKIQKYLSNEK